MRLIQFHIPLALTVTTATLASGTGLAQNVAVSPSCGTTASHFIVSGGLPGPPKTCPDSCHVPGDVRIDNTSVYSFDCGTPFSFDLQNVPGRPPGQTCVACGLAPGPHTLTLSSTGTECSGDTEPRPSSCVEAHFEVVNTATNGDPWSHAFSLSGNGQFITLNFNPCGVCDVAPCDSLLFIQVVRPLAQDSLGHRTKYTYVQQRWPDGARRDSMLTAAGYRVDVSPLRHLPYYLGTYPGTKVPIVSIGIKDGSCGAASMMDNPGRPPTAYRAGVAAIVLEFEVNVYCAAGGGSSQWLGRCTWAWQQPLSGTDTITFGIADRSQPSTTFMDALNHWSALRAFSLPSRPIPISGGAKCK